MARLNEQDVLTGEIAEMPREGTLLPETYKFPRGMTSRQQIIDAHAELDQRRVMNEIWERRSSDLPVKTAAGTGDPGLDRREGDRPRRRAHRASPACSSTAWSSG